MPYSLNTQRGWHTKKNKLGHEIFLPVAFQFVNQPTLFFYRQYSTVQYSTVQWSGVADRNCESDLYLFLGRKVNGRQRRGDNVNWGGGEKGGGNNETESGLNLNI